MNTTVLGPTLIVSSPELQAAGAEFIHRVNTWETLVDALERIAALDPAEDSDQGYNEWGEADCFNKSQDMARAALNACVTSANSPKTE